MFERVCSVEWCDTEKYRSGSVLRHFSLGLVTVDDVVAGLS